MKYGLIAVLLLATAVAGCRTDYGFPDDGSIHGSDGAHNPKVGKGEGNEIFGRINDQAGG